MTDKRDNPLPFFTKLGFGFGSLGTGIYSTVPGVLLLYYLTQVLDISPALAGFVVFIPKVWDVVTDPMMGYLSDRTISRFGRRRPYLLLGAVSMSVTFVFLFSVPESMTGDAVVFYILAVYILSATAYTIYAVPYIAMPSEMSDQPTERTSLMSFRMAFALLGILAGSSLAPYLVGYFGGGRDGYAAMSLVIGMVCALSMLVPFVATKRSYSVGSVKASEPLAFRQSFSSVLSYTPFRWLLLVYVIQLTAMGIFSAMMPFLISDVRSGQEADLGEAFFILVGVSILTIPIWSNAAKTIEKKRLFFAAATLYGAGTVSLLWVGAGSYPVFAAALAVIGAALSGIQLMPFAMLTDVIRAYGDRKNQALEGAFTGIWTSTEKIGLALGPLIAGFGLQIVSTDTSSPTVFELLLLTGFLPGIIILLSAFVVRGYPLEEAVGSARYQEPAHD